MRFDELEFQHAVELSTARTTASHEKDENHWMALADDNRRAGHYENALRFYSRALECDKSLVPAWVGQVQMLVQLQEYPQASSWSQKALEIFPNHAELQAAQAQAECRMGNLAKAYALSDRALRQRGESAYRWQVRGEIVVASRQTSDRHCFDKAQLVDNDWLVPLESALIYLFYAIYNLGQQRAKTAAEKAPHVFHAWYVLGMCQAKLKFDAAAITSFQRCLQLCPRHDGAMSRLAELERPRWLLAGVLGWFRR